MSSPYESAMVAFQKHLHRSADGRFLLDAEDGIAIGISDPVIFADLKRSLDETNRKIVQGLIDPRVIEPYIP
jgi:hypothetical protein